MPNPSAAFIALVALVGPTGAGSGAPTDSVEALAEPAPGAAVESIPGTPADSASGALPEPAPASPAAIPPALRSPADTTRPAAVRLRGRPAAEDHWEARLRIFPFAGYGFRSRVEGIDFVAGAEGVRGRAEQGLAVESLQGALVWGRVYGPFGLLASGMRVGTALRGRATVVGVGPTFELSPDELQTIFRRVRGSFSLGPAIVREDGEDRRSLFLSLDAESPLSVPNLALYVGFSAHLTANGDEEGGMPPRLGVARAGLGLRF